MPSEVQLSITPYTPSTLPSEQALIAAGKALLDTLGSWKQGKTFSKPKGHTPYSVKTSSRSKGPDDGAAWHARYSEHKEGTFDDFWEGLGRDKALKEQQFIPELNKVTLLRSISPTQALWTLHYKFPPPVSPRVFTVLQVTHLAGGDEGNPREGWVISIPVDVSEDAALKAKEEKGVKGRYVSIERVLEGKNGIVHWEMATSSTPGGSIPQFIAEKSMPGQIYKDVPHFVEWLSKNKAPASTSTSTPVPTVPNPTPVPPPPAVDQKPAVSDEPKGAAATESTATSHAPTEPNGAAATESTAASHAPTEPNGAAAIESMAAPSAAIVDPSSE